MDFTIEKYRGLLEALKGHKAFALRHDVDLRPEYSLLVAQVEAAVGVRATYYFRTVPESYSESFKSILELTFCQDSALFLPSPMLLLISEFFSSRAFLLLAISSCLFSSNSTKY